MRCTLALALLAAPAFVSATLKPALTNTKGMRPGNNNCKVIEVSKAIQAAECSHNTRTDLPQTYAVFVTDHKYDGNYGYPYGTCYAYTCNGPSKNDLVVDDDCWTFFWSKNGTDKGVGTGPIRSSITGEAGCERSIDGKFFVGRNDCV
uniref:Small secreted protein n=1 Tax=Peronospora matthiolae TaxID=2874970 RepID=A0AAV1VF09_9STRA